MKRTDIESFLRENRPQVKDNPTFLLEVQKKMREVDGIKSEVDSQRRYGRQAIVLALSVGLICGLAIAALAYLYPVGDLKITLAPWKHYILILIAACAIALGIIFYSNRELRVSTYRVKTSRNARI